MLKSDRWRWTEIWTSVIYPILFFAVSIWIFKGEPLWQALIGSIILWFIFGGWMSIGTFRKLRRAEQRRQLAFSSPQMVRLAQPLLVADPAAIPLPTVIFSQPGWAAYPLRLIGNWLLFVFWLFLWGQFHAGSIASLLLLAAATALLFSIVQHVGKYKWIEVSEEGLTLRDIISRRSIRWHEAELFAIAALVKTNQTSNQYELSSATTILRWSREPAPSRLTRLSSPFPEYAWQMDGLLPLIAGKTGLPLHDLRDWGQQQQPKKRSTPVSFIRRIISNRPKRLTDDAAIQ